MKTVTKTLYLHLNLQCDSYSAQEFDMSLYSDDLVLVATQDVEFTLPDNVNALVIAALEKSIQAVRAEASVKEEAIKDRICKFQQLEHKA